MITTDSTIIDDDVPCPEGDCVPLMASMSKAIAIAITGMYLFNFKSFLSIFFSFGRGGVYFHVGHCGVCRRDAEGQWVIDRFGKMWRLCEVSTQYL